MEKSQTGRSMIEMLGVLAIIGVLSIGAFLGYTMAINHHQTNTLLDYVSKCAVIVQTYGMGDEAVPRQTCKTVLPDDREPVFTNLPTESINVSRVANGGTVVDILFTQTDGVTLALSSRTSTNNNVAFAVNTNNIQRWVSGASVEAVTEALAALYEN